MKKLIVPLMVLMLAAAAYAQPKPMNKIRICLKTNQVAEANYIIAQGATLLFSNVERDGEVWNVYEWTFYRWVVLGQKQQDAEIAALESRVTALEAP